MFRLNREKVIEIVGEALKAGNGNVGVYPYAGEICLRGKVEQKELIELDIKFQALLDYLGLEVVAKDTPTIRKKRRK